MEVGEGNKKKKREKRRRRKKERKKKEERKKKKNRSGCRWVEAASYRLEKLHQSHACRKLAFSAQFGRERMGGGKLVSLLLPDEYISIAYRGYIYINIAGSIYT